jgi:hypothetical protein
VEELDISIYSFPMKYIPLFGEEAKDRNYIGNKWNRKFIRAVQSILNVTKGIVAPGRSFFEKAFGKDLNEFKEILYMPETYIIYRYFFERIGMTNQWRELYYSLNDNEREIASRIIETSDFTNYHDRTANEKVLELLKHYTIKKEEINETKVKDADYESTKKHFDKLIKEDQFKDLTITYDFETEVSNMN